jgi:hypothetical protein
VRRRPGPETALPGRQRSSEPAAWDVQSICRQSMIHRCPWPMPPPGAPAAGPRRRCVDRPVSGGRLRWAISISTLAEPLITVMWRSRAEQREGVSAGAVGSPRCDDPPRRSGDEQVPPAGRFGRPRLALASRPWSITQSITESSAGRLDGRQRPRTRSAAPKALPDRLHVNGWRAALGQKSRRQPMLIAEANVETERSRRYLVQLCEHIGKVGGGAAAAGPPRMLRRPRRDQLQLAPRHLPSRAS